MTRRPASVPATPAARTPAAQTTVRLAIRSALSPTLTVTPRGSMPVTRACSRTAMPSDSISLAALADVGSAISFHLESFGQDALEPETPVLEEFLAEAGIVL